MCMTAQVVAVVRLHEMAQADALIPPQARPPLRFGAALAIRLRKTLDPAAT
jgi:hypothetical protein